MIMLLPMRDLMRASLLLLMIMLLLMMMMAIVVTLLPVALAIRLLMTEARTGVVHHRLRSLRGRKDA